VIRKKKIGSSLLFIVLLLLKVDLMQADEEGDDQGQPNSEILVHGTRQGTPAGLNRLGSPESVIDSDDIARQSHTALGEILATQPGISSSYFGRGASRPIIRGQGKQRVRVLENGLDVGDISDLSDDHAVPLDVGALDRIDVLRGPATLLYGGNAIGGIVNMIDSAIVESPIHKPVTGFVSLRKGNSTDDESSGNLGLSGQSGSLNWHASGFYNETDDFKAPGGDGRLDNSDFLSRGMKVAGTKVWEGGFFGVALRGVTSDYGIAAGHDHEIDHDGHEHEHEHEGEDGDHVDDHDHLEDEILPRINLDQLRFEARGGVSLSDDLFNNVSYGLVYSDYNHKETAGTEIGAVYDRRLFDGRLALAHQHNSGLEGQWGINVRRERVDISGEEAFIPSGETLMPAIFAVEDYKVTSDLTWQIGGRYEFTNVNPDGLQGKNFSTVNFSSGLRQNFLNSDYTADVTASYSERAPTATELFALGPHLATRTFEVGDRSLSKEKSISFEVSLRRNIQPVSAYVSAFWQHYFDYINLIPTSQEQLGLPVFSYALDRARFVGFEARTDYVILDNVNGHALNWYNQLDYVRGMNLSDNESLPRITPLRGTVGMNYNYNAWSGYIEGQFVAEQNKTATFELPTDNYTLLNANVSYDLESYKNSTYQLYLNASNLTNELARVHTSFLKDEVPLRGRAFFLGMRVSL
jgi:iron complex outermembrane receptor protein